MLQYVLVGLAGAVTFVSAFGIGVSHGGAKRVGEEFDKLGVKKTRRECIREADTVFGMAIGAKALHSFREDTK